MLAAATLSLVPGPNQLLSVRNAVRYGTTAASVALLGRFTVFAVMAAAVACGPSTCVFRVEVRHGRREATARDPSELSLLNRSGGRAS